MIIKKNVGRRLLVFVLMIMFAMLVACNSTPPDNTVKTFFDSLKKSDIAAASSCLSNPSKTFTYDNKEQEEIIKQVFAKLEYQIISSSIGKDTATVKTKVIAPDLAKITGQVMVELLPKIFELAFTDDVDRDAKVSELTADGFKNYLSKPELPMITTENDIKLIKDKKKKIWVIEPDDALGNAITGNALKAFEEFEKSQAQEPIVQQETQDNETKPDPNIYSINQEAKIGRAAITVLKVEKSQGNDFDKPKAGMEYIIVTIKKRNVGEGNISYDPYEYKLQNSKGQVTEPSLSIIDSDTHLDSGELISNGEVIGTLAFEAPKDDTGLVFMFVPESEPLLKYSLNK